ncbi:MAG TPA: DUF2382 domain-containing protein [Bacillota bacterium]|nr:DUF2382 domain-containing protein [Bacillota bacterium]
MIKREQSTSSTRQTSSAASGRQTSPELSNLNLERVAGYDAYDKNDEHIGKVSAIWTDRNGQPAYLGVKTFWLLGKTHVVPAYGAMVNNQDERIRLPYLQDDVKNAPSYDPDAELDYAKEQEVSSYYRSKGQRLPESQAERATERTETRETSRTAPSAEEARIPLHEEQMKVGKRQVEVGGVRLRKIIRTETVNQPVELRHEEIVVERVPASERRPGDKAFQGEELYIPLCREEAVVEKETRVREEVRARKTASTERQNVSGQVRREDVQVEKGPQTEVRPAQGTTTAGQRMETAPRAAGRESTGTTREKSTGKKSVFCLARDEAQASRIVDDLKSAGFSNNDISVLLPDKGSTREFAHEKNTKAPEGAITGVGAGGVLGGVLGWLAGIGALAIPGVGPFIAAGPIAAALSGAAVGATAGGIVGTLVGMGIPEYEAKRYESRLKEGRILLSVHSDNADETRRAKEIFERDGAEDIASSGEESVSDRERGQYRKAA